LLLGMALWLLELELHWEEEIKGQCAFAGVLNFGLNFGGGSGV